MNFPRRQQYRRVGRAIATATGGILALGLAVLAASLGAVSLAVILLVMAVGLGADARHWARLAGRSRVGARSEERVQRVLAPLAAEGWRLRHSLPWQGRGDIDSVAIAPTGMAFAIETKATSFEIQHLARVHEMALWLRARRRRWCPAGALPLLCVVHGSRVERVDGDVLDRVPRPASGGATQSRGHARAPAFLAQPARRLCTSGG